MFKLRRSKILALQARSGHLLRVWLRDLLIASVIATIFVTFLYQPVKVEGTSMLPSLEDQERIFINKFVYKLEPIERADIVVFHYPREPQKSYIKRVIALPGDTVKIVAGRVYVNQQLLSEAYVPENYFDYRSYPLVVVPPGRFYVLGDHRSVSSDSRDFGPIEQKYIYGKAAFIYWPFNKAGTLH